MGLGKEGQVEPLNPNIMVGTSFPLVKLAQHLVTDVSLEHRCLIKHQFHQGGSLRPDANAQMLGLVGSYDPSFRLSPASDDEEVKDPETGS